MLHSHIEAMTRLLHLYMDKTLDYTWIKGVSCFIQICYAYSLGPLASNKGWTHGNSSVQLHNSTLPDGQTHSFYFPEHHPSMSSWFKGMEIIICERGLWPEVGLCAQCPDFKCPPSCVDCCCWCILYLQPDFINQKSQLKELIKLHGHICNFCPKYHCELNFIKQYWGCSQKSIPLCHPNEDST